jgi:hypothetical protein
MCFNRHKKTILATILVGGATAASVYVLLDKTTIVFEEEFNPNFNLPKFLAERINILLLDGTWLYNSTFAYLVETLWPQQIASDPNNLSNATLVDGTETVIQCLVNHTASVNCINSTYQFLMQPVKSIVNSTVPLLAPPVRAGMMIGAGVVSGAMTALGCACWALCGTPSRRQGGKMPAPPSDAHTVSTAGGAAINADYQELTEGQGSNVFASGLQEEPFSPVSAAGGNPLCSPAVYPYSPPTVQGASAPSSPSSDTDWSSPSARAKGPGWKGDAARSPVAPLAGAGHVPAISKFLFENP